MKKYIKHIFYPTFTTIQPVDDRFFHLHSTDYCKFCGKCVSDLFLELNINFEANVQNKTTQQLMDYLNKHTKCITEDEFIIKSIIE